MTDADNNAMSVGGTNPVPDQNLDKVFVGIPDVFTTEQLARLHALQFLTQNHFAESWNLKKEEDDGKKAALIAETLLLAEPIAAYLLGG